MTISIVIILLLLICSAFFSATETALTAASKPRLHALEGQGNHRAAITNRLREHMEHVIAAILLGNNLANIMASSLATSVLITLFGEAGVVYATAAITVLVVLFAEVMPKTYAIQKPERTAMAVAPIMRVMVVGLSPLMRLIQTTVRFMLTMIGVKVVTELGSDRTEEELRGAIDLHAGTAEEIREAGAMLHSILDLEKVEVADIMVHRSDVAMIDIDQPVAEIVEQVLASPFTRVPLWQGEPENIVGLLHVKALLRAVQAKGGSLDGLNVVGLAAKPWFIPETTDLLAQLRAFRDRREHFALVVDEYGDFQGIVTLEDIIEEIVGDIKDEHDMKVEGVEIRSDGSFIVDGRVTLRDLNREFGWKLPDQEASTLAGLILHEARRIPEEGQVFSFHGLTFEVLQRERNQVRLVKVIPATHVTEPKAGAATTIPTV